MKSRENCKTSMVFGIISMILALFSPVVGVVLGIIGLNVTREQGKEDRDLILNWIGIGIALLNFFIALAVMDI